MARPSLGDRLTDLRRAFDQAFSAPPPRAPEETVDLLAIRVAGDPYGFDVRELVSLAPSGKVVPLPSRRMGLLGLTGIRGTLVPVFSLGVLLGYEPSRSPARWLGLAGSPDPVALAFDEHEGFLRARRSDVYAETPRRHVSAALRSENITRMVVDTNGLIAALKVSTGTSSTTKEH